MNWKRIVASALFTTATLLMFFVALGVSQFGDCAEDVITGTHQGPCIDEKTHAGRLVLAVGALTLLAGNWLILRRRRF